MSTDIDSVVRWELGRLAKLDLLDDGEVLCEARDAMMNDSLGALVVTDLRVLFLKTGVLRRRTRVVSVPLDEIVRVEASDSANVLKQGKWGALAMSTRDKLGHEQRIELDGISGGRARAEEIVRTIVRQRGYLQEPPADSAD